MHAPRGVTSGRAGIFAPSSPFPRDRFERGAALLRKLGFEIHEPPQISERAGYLAGADDARLHTFHQLLADPDVDVLWAARGGYGVHRIIDRVDADLIRRANKAIVGFSDISSLHAIAQSRAELISIHGPVVTQLGELGERDLEYVARVVGGAIDGLTYPCDGPSIRGGVARGRLAGGCLSVLAPLLGTPFFPPLDGAILILEDVGEATYRVDRLLTHLRLAGVFQRVAGVVLGDFIACEPRNPEEPRIEAVLSERLGDLGIPVLAGLPLGHGRRNLAIPLGARATLDADRGELRIEGA